MAVQDLYGWFPMNQQFQVPGRMTIPEQSPGALIGDTTAAPGMLGFTSTPGALSQQAAALANANRIKPPQGAALGSGGMGGYLPAMGGGGDTDPTANNKFRGAAEGAAAGANFGPWGALIGAGIGYTAEGGYKDANPIDASGFSGITMDQAWRDQNLLRLASNPVGALASKAGIKSNSVLGQLLDPTDFLGAGLFRSKKGDEKRNLNAFLKEYTVTDAGNGMYALPDGLKVNAKQLERLAGTWYGATYAPDGDQAGWQDKYNELLGELYSQPMYDDFGG